MLKQQDEDGLKSGRVWEAETLGWKLCHGHKVGLYQGRGGRNGGTRNSEERVWLKTKSGWGRKADSGQ